MIRTLKTSQDAMPSQTRSARIQPPRFNVAKADNAASSVVRTQRALETLRLMQSGQTWTAAELADRFGCSSRTIFRDMQLLRDCGIPVESPPGERGFRLAHDFFWKPVRPTLDELIALVIGARLAADSMPPDLARRMAAALDKVVSAAQPAVRERLSDLTLRIDTPHRVKRPQLPDVAFLSLILEQIVTRLPVVVSLRQPGDEAAISATVVLEQLTIVENTWHLVGAYSETGDIFSVPLGKIEAVESPATSPPRATQAAPTAQAADSSPSTKVSLRIEQD